MQPAEAILAELMTASAPLDFGWLARRVARECNIGGSAASDALIALERAGLVHEPFGRGVGWWSMTDEGRTQLQTRPPYNCYRAILDEVAARGPLTFGALQRACRQQAQDYSAGAFTTALYDLVRSGEIQHEWEPGDTEATYDLPN